MSPYRTGARLLAAGLATAAAAAALVPAAHAGPAEPTVPGAIAVEEGHKPFLVGHAVGVQTYACTATATGFGWSFTGPRAVLYDDGGKVLTRHFGGPTWQARDGSAVVGQRVRGVPGEPGAIEWLLLSAASTSAGADGDRLEGTTFIQRLATTGGLAPAAAGCDAATAGTRAEVPYTADYVFWKAKSPE